jgi:chloramphenicol O-acetyltransferase type B
MLWTEDAQVSIGSFNQIGDLTKIHGGGNHRVDWATTFLLRSVWGLSGERDVAYAGPTRIGNDVWFGTDVTVVSGAQIGDGCVIGANAVVRGRIPPYTIAVGNPAAVVKARFREDTIARLLDLAWWNWPLERILYNADRLCSNPDQWPAELEFPDAPRGFVAPPRSLGFRPGAAPRLRSYLERGASGLRDRVRGEWSRRARPLLRRR